MNKDTILSLTKSTNIQGLKLSVLSHLADHPHLTDNLIGELQLSLSHFIKQGYTTKNFTEVGIILDLVTWLYEEKKIDLLQCLSVIEDTFEKLDTLHIEEFFPHLEKLGAKQITEEKAKTVMLRINNSLLKRLSKRCQAKFRFRVQLLLASSIALISERSGVNFKGNFASRATKTQISNDTVFSWILNVLSFSRDPITLFKDSDKFDRCLEHIENLLEHFKTINIEKSSMAFYLPEARLFEFQVKDSEFICFIVTLIMLLAQTLTSPANQVQTSVFILSELQKNKLGSIVLKSKDILNEINPPILKIIESSLNNELFWVKWKLNQCQAFEKESCIEVPSKHEIELEEGEVGNDEVKTNKSEPLFDEYLQEPTMENYLERVYADLDPDEGIEEEYKCKKDPVYSWRLLRLVSQNRIDIFGRLDNIDVEKVAIEIKKDAGEWVEPEENGEKEGSNIDIVDEIMEESNNGFSEEKENEEMIKGVESEGFEEGEELKDEENDEEEGMELEKEVKEKVEKIESKREGMELEKEIKEKAEIIENKREGMELEKEIKEKDEKIENRREGMELEKEIKEKAEIIGNKREGMKLEKEIKEKDEQIENRREGMELEKEIKEKAEKIEDKKEEIEIHDIIEIEDRKINENAEKITSKREVIEIHSSPRKSPKMDEEKTKTEEKEKIISKKEIYISSRKSPKREEKIRESEQFKKNAKEIQDFSRKSPKKEEKEVEKIPIKREGKEIHDSPRKSPKIDKSS
ncbi:unnamed protein product [Blepharisma stoltei]|uniref:THO complex subunitTHOC2 C-terminal domain-containing protein n=1 Tax=Blepharisma stoltei TaxID=1481888 RepID=A0AAU9KKS4_9CILI|nr:unnamed protein product [Blepharisma stoltei]